MNESISGTEAKAADRYAIDIMGIPSLTLMESASSHVADYIRSNYMNTRVLIVCGTGNNGADGVCIGRILKEHGFDPVVICCGNIWKATWEFLRQLSDYVRLGGRLLQASEIQDDWPEADVLIDAIFGIGLKRTVKEPYRSTI